MKRRDNAVCWLSMRFVFAFLAVVALLASPVTATVAQAGCDHPASASMHGADMASMPGMNGVAVTPCGGGLGCDHSTKHNKAIDPGCAAACAAACAVTIALVPALKTAQLVTLQAEMPGPRAAVLHPFEPQGLKRPPKLMG